MIEGRRLSNAGIARRAITALLFIAFFIYMNNKPLMLSYHPSDSLINTIQIHSRELINNTMDSDLGGCEPSEVPNDTLIPIFVLNRDRLSSLKMSIESYKNFSSPYELIILDHNSTYPPMVQYLRKLNDTKEAHIHAIKADDWNRVLAESADFIERYLESRPKIQFYVFTDPDIAFIRSAPDVLLFYAGILSSCKHVNVVGPHLQISDIPDMYSGKQKVQQKQNRWWAEGSPPMATWNMIGYHIGKSPIDTTFAMRRRGYRFARLQPPSIRAYAPYAAVHVDWYQNSSFLPADKVWYKLHLEQKEVNHWRKL